MRPVTFKESATRSTATAFLEACEIIGVQPPATDKEAVAFVSRCLKGARTKAELFGKASHLDESHAKRLDWIAMICGFPDGWHGLNSYAKQFPRLSPAARAASPLSVGMTLGAWVLTDEIVARVPLARTVTTLLRNTLQYGSNDDEVAEIILRRVFFKGEYSPTKRSGYDAEELAHVFREGLGWAPDQHVASMLGRLPVVDGECAA